MNKVQQLAPQDDLDVDLRKLKEKINSACNENPELPRSFVRASIISLSDSKRNLSKFVPRSNKSG
jgi:hypothetical protein